MKCVNPAKAFILEGTIVWRPKPTAKPIQLPCGHCFQCRRESSLDTATRAWHELSYWDNSDFITLTYDNQNLKSPSLNREHINNFIREIRRDRPKMIIFGCGEYGEKYSRPHFHLILMYNQAKPKLHESIKQLWTHGFVSIDGCSAASIQYVAKYSVKKILGRDSKKHYEKLGLTAEFGIFPRRPAMGRRWFDDNKNFIATSNRVWLDQTPRRIPRYYYRLFQEKYPEEYAIIKEKRMKFMQDTSEDTNYTKYARTTKYLSLSDTNSLRPDGLDFKLLGIFKYIHFNQRN